MSVTDELELRFDRNVSPALVHKRAIEQVLLTDSARRDDDEFVCAAQLPRAHAFYNDTVVPVYDAVLLLEVMRQSVEMLAHRHLGVPDGQAFILRSIELDVEDVAATRVGPAPAHVVVEETIRDRGYVADDLARLELAGVLHLDGRRFASATGSCLFLSPRDYAEIRGPAGGPARSSARAPAAPALVGRRDTRNVTISEPVASDGDSRAFEVIVDRDHSTFFDHPLDHVPGMLMVEAARQAALAAASPAGAAAGVVVGVDATFPGFAEFDEALVCSASPVRHSRATSDRLDVSVRFEQNGKPTARLGVAVAFPGDQAADGTFERRSSSA